MPVSQSIDEILKNVTDAMDSAAKDNIAKSNKWMAIAILSLFSGIAAMLLSVRVFAAMLLFAAVLCYQKSNTHYMLAEMANHNRAMAHLIGTVAR